MLTVFFVAVILVLVAINLFLWKSGFLFDAERPKALLDRPVTDARARNAVRRRLARWREEGKISRAEAEHWERLCEEEWDPPEEARSAPG